MINFGSFSDELVKISKERNVIRDGRRVWVDDRDLTPEEASYFNRKIEESNERFRRLRRPGPPPTTLAGRPWPPVKTAEELAYRKAHGVELAEGIPLVRRLSQAPERARDQLLRATSSSKSKAKKILGYTNVAVHEDKMPDLKEMGFKRTRIATPLPGESVLSNTWRSGKLHAHKQGPFFLLHQDEEAPMGRFGYLNPKAIKHGVKEGLPSMIKRIREKQALVRTT